MPCPICAGAFGDNVTCHGSTPTERREQRKARHLDARQAPDDTNTSLPSDTSTSPTSDTFPCG